MSRKITLRRYGIPYTKKHRSSGKVKPEELRKFVREHPDSTQQQIAKHFDCSIRLISCSLKRYDIPYVRKNNDGKRPDSFRLQPEKLRKYVYENPNLTQAEIAAYFGCDRSVTSRALRKYGIAYTRRYGCKVAADKLKKYVHKNPFVSTKKIAKVFGMSEGYIRRALNRHKINRIRETWKAEAIKAYIHDHPGTFQQEIAEHFGISPSSVCRRLKRYGIKL